MIEQQYVAIGNHLAAAMPELKTIELFESQPDLMESEDAYAMPAVFIEFADFRAESSKQGWVIGPATIAFHCQLWNLANTDTRIGSERMLRGLERLATIRRIHQHLQGFAANNMGALTFQSYNPEIREVLLPIDVLRYTTKLYIPPAITEEQTVQLGLSIKGSIKLPVTT